MLVVIVTITVDSQIGNIADFFPEQITSQNGVFAFMLITVIFVLTQYLILNYVKQLNKDTGQQAPHLSKLHTYVTTLQYLLVGMIMFVFLQILLANQYNILTL